MKISGVLFVCLSVFICLILPTVSYGEDWPAFRGVNQNGISNETGWKTEGRLPILWQAKVGLGYSAATVSNGRVFITGHDEPAGLDRIFCFDEETGKTLWVKSYPQPLGNLYFQGGTTASVTADGNRIFHVAREGEFFCLNPVDGSELWKTHLAKAHGYSKSMWGFSGAPLIDGDRLYITAGESGLALDKTNGKVIWKSSNADAGYSTPYLFERNGEKLLMFSNKRFYNCVRASNGKKLWEIKWMTRWGVNAADPIVSGNNVFISSGYGKGAVLLNWTGGNPSTVWKSRDMKTQMNAVIHINGYLYGFDGNENQDGTVFKCLEMATGKTMWSDGSLGCGSVSVADGKLIVLSEQGELQFAPVSPTGYRPFFKQQVITGRVWTVPVLANGRIYCRNDAGDVTVVDARGEQKVEVIE